MFILQPGNFSRAAGISKVPENRVRRYYSIRFPVCQAVKNDVIQFLPLAQESFRIPKNIRDFFRHKTTGIVRGIPLYKGRKNLFWGSAPAVRKEENRLKAVFRINVPARDGRIRGLVGVLL
jgi:hypothetical protein